ncbi:MAG: guanylate kinase [Candidatus Omnitrophota bacterium]
MKVKGLIFVISGPSGSGKTTLASNIVKDKTLRKKLRKPVSFTTRFRRSKEKNGRDYFFISEKEFQKQRRGKKILEWTKYLGYYYATPRDFIERELKKGRHIILCLDLKGALKVKRLYSGNTITFFIMPPSLRELHKRIKKRCKRTKHEEVRRRLGLARREIQAARRYDYCLVNKNLREVTGRLKRIILNKISREEKGKLCLT